MRLFLNQVRFAVKFLSGGKELPSKAEMLADEKVQSQKHWNKGYRKHYTHFLGPEQKEYFKDISDAAEIDNLPDVLSAMWMDNRKTMMGAPAEYRKFNYYIVDDKTFKKEPYNSS